MGSLRIGPISLGERRKVAEQREMLRAVLGLQAGANYPPAGRLSQPKCGRKMAERLSVMSAGPELVSTCLGEKSKSARTGGVVSC